MHLMDVTPTTPTKRARTKAAATDAPAVKPGRKTLTTAKKKKVAAPGPEVTQAIVEKASAAPAPADLHALIERTAFFMAAERGFAPGRELDDWLEAERRVRAQFSA
jgi:hypothetical protein